MKRTDIKRRPLSDTVLPNLEPELKEYRELDGDGLYFRGFVAQRFEMQSAPNWAKFKV